jgi:adenylate cyclase
MSDDIEQEYFSDGITEDIITELSRYRELFVIARNSTFSFKGQAVKVQDVGRELGVGYIVEGSVRKAGNRIRITAQLVEAETGNHIWAERFDSDLENIFDVQDEVTQAIVAVLPVRIHGAVLARATRKPVESLTAYEHLLRARWRWTQDATEVDPVIDELKIAIALDPGYARAYAWLAHAYAQSTFSQGHSHDEHVRQARAYAEKALRADDQDAFVHAIAGLAYANCGDAELAKSHADRALALNPNEFFAIFVRAIVLNYSGHPGEAIDWFMKSRRLDPQAPDFYLEPVIECYYMLHAYEKAIETFKLWHDPPFYMYDVLAACHAQLGNMQEAEAARAHFARLKPEGFIYAEGVKAHLGMMQREGDRKHWLEGFRKAGLPV